MILFAVATLTPVLFLALGALIGGLWGWAALLYITALVFTLDYVIARAMPNRDPKAEFPATKGLLAIVGLSHLALICLVIWAVGGASGLSGWERGALAVAAALFFGQVGHPCAHELIHQKPRALRLLGRLVYTSMLMGHHASAHMLIHHVHVGTEGDPNSPPKGLGFYSFLRRAWRGSFQKGLAAERARLARAGKSRWRNPYLLYVGGAGVMALYALFVAGLGGLLTLLFLGSYATLQILMADYVQHYGLRRLARADGRYEPVGPQHSWNAPHWMSSAMTLNAPRHSDHHVTPTRPYPNLQLDTQTMPELPNSLPVMAVLALWPRAFKKVMDPLAEAWMARNAARLAAVKEA